MENLLSYEDITKTEKFRFNARIARKDSFLSFEKLIKSKIKENFIDEDE